MALTDTDLADYVTSHRLWQQGVRNNPHPDREGLVRICLAGIQGISAEDFEEVSKRVLAVIRSKSAQKGAKTRKANKDRAEKKKKKLAQHARQGVLDL